MGTWHVWGDYGHTRPDRIGSATRVNDDDRAARKTAEAHGFDFERRVHNGFTPWASSFRAEDEDGLERAFADNPIVKGWQKV